MAEAARKIPDQQPDVLRVLRMIEGGQPEEISLEAAALRLVNYVQRQIKAGVDLETMSEILNGLEALLRILPKKPIIIELFPEKEKKDSPEKRKGSVSERLRVVQLELEVPKENKSTETKDPVVEAFIAEQRRLFLRQDGLKARSKKGEKVEEELTETTRLLEENRARLQQALREKEKPQPLSEEAKAELERKMAAAFTADPEVKPPQTAEERARWEAEKDRAVDEWIEKIKPKPASTTVTPVQKKESFYPHVHETQKVVDEALRILEEVQLKEPQLQGEARMNIRKSLMALDKGATVGEFLVRVHETMAACLEYSQRRNDAPDHPLFQLAQSIQQLFPKLPTPEQAIYHRTNVTRAQMQQVREAIQQCLSKIGPDKDEELQELADSIKRKAMNPRKSPTRARMDKLNEAWNEEKKWVVFRAKRAKRQGRNKW